MQEDNWVPLSHINVSHVRIKDWDAFSIRRIFGGNKRMRHIRDSPATRYERVAREYLHP